MNKRGCNEPVVRAPRREVARHQKVVYCEPFSGGHRADYVEALIKYILRHDELRVQLIIFGSHSLYGQLDVNVTAELTLNTRVVYLEVGEPQHTFRSKVAYLKEVRRVAAEQIGSDAVILIPSIDDFLVELLFFPRFKFDLAGVVFRPAVHYGCEVSRTEYVKEGIKFALYFLVFGRWRGVSLWTLDYFFFRYVKSKHASFLNVYYLPDMAPVSVEQPTRLQGGKEGGRVRFLLFGALQKRKGIYELIRAVGRLPGDVAEKVHLRMCGRLYEDPTEMNSLIEEASRATGGRVKIELEDRYFSKKELCEEVKCCDVVLAPYLNHKGSSGVLYWGATYGKPIVAQSTGLVGAETRKYRLGETVRPGDIYDLVRIITEIAESGSVQSFSADDARYYGLGHSQDDFARSIFQTYSQEVALDT